MKKIAISLLGALCIVFTLQLSAHSPNNSSYSSGSQLSWSRSYSEAMQQSKNTSKPIVILFTGSNWCPACMKLEREVLSKPEFAQAVGNNFVFYKVEITEPTEEAINRLPDKSLLDRYNVEAFPTMVIVDANGQKLFNIPYQTGGVSAYIRDLNSKINQSSQESSYYR